MAHYDPRTKLAEGGRHPRLTEIAVVAIGLAVLAAIVYGPHTLHGGFVSDAWTILAILELAQVDGLEGTLARLLELDPVKPRPLQGVYLAVLYETFGWHMGVWLAWLVATGVLMSLAIYALLRELDLGRIDAGAVAALVLVFPAASSIRLWTGVAAAPLTIALAALGFVLAMRAFRARGTARTALHCGSVALFAASVLLYEIALPLILASVLVYRLRVPWKPALKRWAADCAVVVPIVLLVTRSTASPWGTADSGGMWSNVTTTWDQAKTLLATVVLPFGSDSWYVLGLVALVPAAALAVLLLLEPGDPARRELRRWLTVIAGGLAVVVLGYAIFVPVELHRYVPLDPGVRNRVNAVPSVGWVLMLYGLAMLLATMATRGLPRARRHASALALLACALAAAHWMPMISDDASAYERGYLEGQRTVSTIVGAVPEPPRGSVIWAFGQPVEVAPAIPVFFEREFTFRIKLAYRDMTVNAYIGLAGTTFRCSPKAIVAGGHPVYVEKLPWTPGPVSSPYGRTYFVDTRTGRAQRIDTPAQCRRAVPTFPRSPQMAPGA